VIVASKGGAPDDPGWFKSLAKSPEVGVQIRSDRYRARARVAEGEERERLWELMNEVWPHYASTRRRPTGRFRSSCSNGSDRGRAATPLPRAGRRGGGVPVRRGDVVFKAGGKMFALAALQRKPLRVSVKCDPELGEQLRASYTEIEPGYHLNKRHWLTLTCGGEVSDELVRELVIGSHELVGPR